MTMAQLALPLDWPAGPADDAFILSPSNAHAAALLADPAAWPTRAALLVGPRKSGRTLLSRIFAARTGGAVVDDAETRDEAALFHAWNGAQGQGRPLLIVADAAPPLWPIRLPDLRSRLAASTLARIGAPDDALIRALLERQFLRRGLDARADLLDWLAGRIERTNLAVARVAEMLERAAWEGHRRLSIPFAREALKASALLMDEPRLI